MNKRISVGLSAAVVIIAVTITFTATMIFSMKLYDQKVRDVKERAAMYNTLYELDTLVRENYYADIDDNLALVGTLEGFLDGLGDDYSYFMTSSEIEAVKLAEEGTGVSMGFEVVRSADGYMQIKSIIANSSASDEGLKQGDIVTGIDNNNVLELGYAEAVKLLAVSEGDAHTIYVNRDGREIIVDLVAEKLDLLSIDSQLYDTIGYLRIKSFNSLTASQFDYALNQQLQSDIKGLIIDLRGCYRGTSVQAAATALDSLVGTGTIVSATYSGGVTKVLYTSGAEKVNIPIVVIVDSETEYLAELFAAVLRDMNNCLIVGEPTVGHGTMQSILKLTDGNGISITVATLNPPVSQSFDGTGITPDYEVYASDSFVMGDGIPDESTDAQFKKAMDVLNTQISG